MHYRHGPTSISSICRHGPSNFFTHWLFRATINQVCIKVRSPHILHWRVRHTLLQVRFKHGCGLSLPISFTLFIGCHMMMWSETWMFIQVLYQAHHDHLKRRMIYPRCQLYPKYMYTVSQVALMGNIHPQHYSSLVSSPTFPRLSPLVWVVLPRALFIPLYTWFSARVWLSSWRWLPRKMRAVTKRTRQKCTSN